MLVKAYYCGENLKLTKLNVDNNYDNFDSIFAMAIYIIYSETDHGVFDAD